MYKMFPSESEIFITSLDFTCNYISEELIVSGVDLDLQKSVSFEIYVNYFHA